MTQKKVNLLKGIFLVIIFTAAVLLADRILMLKSRDGIEQMRSFYKQKENTVDVIFLGSSRSYRQIDTGVIWDDYGISSFDLGGAEAPSWVSYYYLKEAFKTQKPKVVMYETTVAGHLKDVLYQKDYWVITNNYGFKLNKNRFDQLKENTSEENFKKFLIPLGTTHTNYNNLSKEDFVDSFNSINNKGFVSIETVMSFDAPDISGVVESTPIDEKHIIYIDKMKELCDENGADFIVHVTPYMITEDEQKCFNYIFSHCEEKGIPYIDFNKMYDELNMDFDKDMAEDIHVSFTGSKKLSDYIGQYVKNEYNLSDHRGDKEYSSWDVDALFQRQDRNRHLVETVENDSEFFDAINNENYITYITFGLFNEITEEDKALFNKIGIVGDCVKNGYSIVLNRQGESFINDNGSYDYFLDEGDVKLLFRSQNPYTDKTLNVSGDTHSFSTYSKATVVVYDRVLKRVIAERIIN